MPVKVLDGRTDKASYKQAKGTNLYQYVLVSRVAYLICTGHSQLQGQQQR